MTATADNLLALKSRLCAHAEGIAGERFASLMQALALSKQNTDAKDHRATLTITLELRPDGDGWTWTAQGKVSHPAVDKGEAEDGEYDPTQPELGIGQEGTR